MVKDLSKIIARWAEEPKHPDKLRKCYPNAETMSEPDIRYYHRNAVRYMNAKKAYEEANAKGDWNARNNAGWTISNVEKKFSELLGYKKVEL